jgi:hypothetical protein
MQTVPCQPGRRGRGPADAACASAPSNFSYTVPLQPEGSSGYTEKPGWATTKFAVAAANPLATDAGYQILKAGGRRWTPPSPCRWC